MSHRSTEHFDYSVIKKITGDFDAKSHDSAQTEHNELASQAGRINGCWTHLLRPHVRVLVGTVMIAITRGFFKERAEARREGRMII